MQILPTGIGPEGLKAIPKRNLFVASTEKDEVDAGAEIVYIVIQRAWLDGIDTDTVNTKIGRYDVATSQWGFVHYPLSWKEMAVGSAFQKSLSLVVNNSQSSPISMASTPPRVEHCFSTLETYSIR